MGAKRTLISKATDYRNSLSCEKRYKFDELARYYQFECNRTKEEATIETYLESGEYEIHNLTAVYEPETQLLKQRLQSRILELQEALENIESAEGLL